MINYKNTIIFILFLTYFFIGVFLSLTNGISHDQLHEQLNWKTNFQAIQSVFNDKGDYKLLLAYIDKYHGIGFHYISQPIQFLIHGIVGEFTQVTVDGSYYLSRHAVVFLIFSLSGYFFYLLCLKISENKNFSLISVILFLLYPYFFGHAQINGKDIPFMSIWIIATYFLINVIEKFYYNKKIDIKLIFYISFVTSFLISIRIVGILILIQYLIALLILLNLRNLNFFTFIKKNIIFFSIFTILLIIFTYLLNPILWLNPLEIINSVKWMGKYYHDVCTLTLGSCMKALNLPSSYMFIWFFFKLPIIILLGLFLFPFVEEKILKKDIKTIIYGTSIITPLSLLFIFIIKNVALYDEIRHVMFLIPFLFLVALYNIFIFNKKFFYYSSIFVIIFFIIENISLKKYQYTWLNSFAKFTNIQKNFEIDYMGVSNKNLQNQIVKYSLENKISKDTCVYGNLYTNVFLQQKGFTCFKLYSFLDSAKNRPFFAYQNVRNIKRNKPNDCKLIHSEKYNYIFFEKDIVTGKLWYCD